MSLKGKTLFITGASRGIGHAIAVRAAQDGANVAIVAKSEKENEKLPGTIYSSAKDIEAVGGKALPIACDIRSDEQVQAAIEKTVKEFGGIDILVNNASAINLSRTSELDMKRYDLMHSINARGTFLCSKLAYPYLKEGKNPHILNISPPLNMSPRWFAGFVGYTMAKYGMSMCTLGMAEEFRRDGIAVNSLWPETAIATAAVKNLLGGDEAIKGSRSPAIMSDAAYIIFNRVSAACTGNFFIDVKLLCEEGIEDFSQYAVSPGHELMRDFFLDEWYSPSLIASGKQ